MLCCSSTTTTIMSNTVIIYIIALLCVSGTRVTQFNVGGTKKTRGSMTPTHCPATRSSLDCPRTTRLWNAWTVATIMAAHHPSAATSRHPSTHPCPWFASGMTSRRHRSPTPSSGWCRTACSCTTTGAATVCPSRSFWRPTTCDRLDARTPATPLSTKYTQPRHANRTTQCNNLF